MKRNNGEIMTIYPNYNPEAKCPKCGNIDVGTKYKKGYHEWLKDEYYYNWRNNIKLSKTAYYCKCDKEHFHRKCKRCKYGWIELLV